jgi:hypothetical protein
LSTNRNFNYVLNVRKESGSILLEFSAAARSDMAAAEIAVA